MLFTIVSILLAYLMLSAFGYALFWESFPKYQKTIWGRVLLILFSWTGFPLLIFQVFVIGLPKFFYQWVVHGKVMDQKEWFKS